LPAALRGRLAAAATITLPTVRQMYPSRDGSIRYLFGLADSGADARRKSGPAAVEAVFMPSSGRQTICISTQAGCAVDCQFCLTAQLGLIRNLTAAEILAQVLLPLERHKAQLAPQTNLVLMGQGEPLLNFDAVMAALRIILDPEGLALTPKHVTLSTSGIVPGIERLAKEKIRPKLAISLNASNDEQRDAVMPINRKYPIAALMEACQKYPLRPWEHLTFEYVMLGGMNDSPEDARRVARLIGKIKSVKVNLIPWNPGELPYRESTAESIEEFRKTLVDRGVPAFVRYSRGRDVMAACGQLALLNIAPSNAASAVPRV
jgi:23S rRNA (adenine2503-C2)-methyltransferase